MVRGPYSKCPLLTPSVARLASGFRYFSSIRLIRCCFLVRRRFPSGYLPCQGTLAAPKDAVALQAPDLVSNATGKPVVNFELAKNGCARSSLLFYSLRFHPPLAVELVVGFRFTRPLLKLNQRGALFQPRSGSASDRRLQPTDYFFKDDCSCLAALRSPSSPTGPGNSPVLRWEIRFGGSNSLVWSLFDSSTPRSTGPLTLRRLPRELDASPSRLTRFWCQSSRLV
jgi:hypothetical protein